MQKVFIITLMLLSGSLFAQPDNTDYENVNGSEGEPIRTLVPFLNISPDSRAGAMGDAGVATTPDVYSQHWNAAKYAFINKPRGFGISYTPWLKGLGVPDMYIGQLVGFTKLDDRQTVSGSLVYFHLGNITFTTEDNVTVDNVSPNEFALDMAYTFKFTPDFSMSLTGKYIYSGILKGANATTSSGSKQYIAGQSGAVDLGFYYQKDIVVNERDGQMAYGLNISNVGNKMTFEKGGNREFIPTNLRLGGRYSTFIDEYNSLMFTLDVNKLLVPTPPNDTADLSVVEGIFTSFGDAPGGFKEELHELMYSLGAEWWYRDQFAIRGGLFYEHESKGNRKYGTVGVGVKLNILTFDFAYLLAKNSPLSNTVRFTIGFNFDQ